MISFSSFRPVKREEVLHSSAFGQAAAGAHVGTTDRTTFSQRQAREKSRVLVGAYDQAGLHQTYREAPKIATPGVTALPTQPVAKLDIVRPSRQSFNATRGPVAIPTRPFREPPSRSFNPYS